MYRRRSAGVGIILFGLGLSALPLGLGGCGDESRTTGTQVKISEETKAQVGDMRSTFKEMGKGKRKN